MVSLGLQVSGRKGTEVRTIPTTVDPECTPSRGPMATVLASLAVWSLETGTHFLAVSTLSLWRMSPGTAHICRGRAPPSLKAETQVMCILVNSSAGRLVSSPPFAYSSLYLHHYELMNIYVRL